VTHAVSIEIICGLVIAAEVIPIVIVMLVFVVR